MATATLPKNPIANWEKVRDEWIDRLKSLVDDVETWAKELGWATRRIEKRMEDSQLGEYRAPALVMQEGFARIQVEPIARFATGVEGVVDLYLMPAYDDIASLSFAEGKWRVHSWTNGAKVNGDVLDAEPIPLSKEVLAKVLGEMSQNAA